MIAKMKKELETRFISKNADAVGLKIVWVKNPRIITFPTGKKAYHGEFRAIANGYKDVIHYCGFRLDGSFEYFN